MPPLDTVIPTTVYDLPAATVATRSSWSDAWSTQTHLTCEAARHSTGATISEATFRYSYGSIMREGTNTYQTYAPLDIGNYFVRVSFNPNTGGVVNDWYGVMVLDERRRMGSSPVESGEQHLTAFGLEWLLQRERITTSVVQDGAGKKTIGRGLAFNGYQGRDLSGNPILVPNRSTAVGPDGVYLFASNLTGADMWSAEDIVKYLLFYHGPMTGAGAPAFTADTLTTGEVLGWYEPIAVATEGRTVYDVINQLVSRQLAAAWSVQVFDDPFNEFELNFYSQLSSAVVVNGKTMAANGDQVQVDFENQIDVADAVELIDTQREFKQVVVRGARRGACFSIGYQDGTIVADWASADLDTYKTPSTNIPGYASLNREKKKEAADKYRSRDELERVWTHFRIPSNWNGFAGSGDGLISDFKPVCPQTISGTPTALVEPFWFPGLRLSRMLPLRTDRDYSQAGFPSLPSTGGQPELRPAFAAYQLPDGKYQYADRLSANAYTESKGDGGFDFSAHFRPQEATAGIVVQPTGLQHLQALSSWLPGFHDLSEVEAQVDWLDMIATVHCEWDAHVQESYPDPASAAEHNRQDVLTIDVGDRARLDYLTPNTVVGIDGSGALVKSPGGFVRDDRGLLQEIARISWEWYQTPRRAFQIVYRQLTVAFRVGQLITQIGPPLAPVSVNSLVTSITWDFVQGTTTIRTAFDDIDFSGLAGGGVA